MTPHAAPPCTMTSAMITLVAEIAQTIGRLTAADAEKDSLRLRRVNRIRTIQGSLAIEGNTLTQEQITAILDGKKVIAPPREIQEVRSAIKAYDLFEQWTPHSETDLLKAHSVLMAGLIDAPGMYRTGGVGVMSGSTVIHMAPPASRVPDLMASLLEWLKTTELHPLISSSIFHYEFEFIHPFEDGNGRMGRLWQTLILSRCNPIFANVPVESMVYSHQKEYYDAISRSTKNGESSVFVEFMLRTILEALTVQKTPGVTPQVTPEVKKLLASMAGDMSRAEIQAKLGLKDEKHFREAYLRPAAAQGLIEMTIPDKPNSRLQKYRLTEQGQSMKKKNNNRR